MKRLTSTCKMKSTKLQNPRCILHYTSQCAYTTTHALNWLCLSMYLHSFVGMWICSCGYIVKVHAPDYTWWSLFSLQHGLAASVGIVRDKAGCYVVHNCWVTSGAELCFEQRKLIAAKPEYWLFSSHLMP